MRESRNYRYLFIGQLISLIGRQITVVAVPYQVFLLTRSSLAVGLLGVVQLVPYVLCSFVAGALADRIDRRVVLLWTQTLLAACSGLFMLAALAGRPPVPVLYGIAALAAGISAVDQPARSATIPNLVRRSQLPSAISLNFALFQTGALAGPAIGGAVIARVGLPVAYGIDVATFAAAIVAVFLLTPQVPVGKRAESPVQALSAGFAFLRRLPVVMGGYALDLNAMILSSPRAVFPALGLTVFHVGPAGLGLLYAAPGVGAIIGSLFSGFIRHLRHPGRAVLFAVGGWGLGITLFGLVTASFPLALLFLACAGGSDALSAIARNTIQQTVAPDRLRGRLAAVGSMVVVGGPYLGDTRAGIVASATGPGAAVVLGGLMCLGGCAVLPLAFRGLWTFDMTAGAPPE
ncbi:MAG TPA: MFS transporter [Candidatus Limnocylindrales bacterium]|nr:MFS transporter [Candidatus Limnocylindrales bacterium]